MDDWVLAHLKVVIATKLRRHEAFTISWRHPDGTGRSTIWLHSAIALRFTFDDPQTPELDPSLLHAFADAANSPGGITLDAAHILTDVEDPCPRPEV
ncbi:hypothetical protein [Microbacterium sp.]|uniref:DUF7882 family protein n=1 Tax=Microbacterium sp. TaxID=51671 RepID=UPI0039E50826